MTYEDLVWQFTKDLQFDALKHWCAIFDIDYEKPPIDDLYPAREAEIRTELAEAMMKVGEKNASL